MKDKIKTLEETAEISSLARQAGKKIVLCHGIFDLMHIGHIRHLEQARQFGDLLIVTVTQDVHVNRGPHRPVFNEILRAETLAALEFVDYVALNPWPSAVETLQKLNPHAYVKGSDFRDNRRDYDNSFTQEVDTIRSLGGEVYFTGEKLFSSSNLINHHFPIFPKEVIRYLEDVSSRYAIEDILKYLDPIRPLRILTVGETIIDEYHYCDTLGKSGKEPILASRYVSEEKFAGGILAVANNAAGFSDHVDVLTILGDQNSHEAFIREQLRSGVGLHSIERKDSPTIVKRRFVEMYPFQKLFEVYFMNPKEKDPHLSQALCTKMDTILPEYDVVIVTDYGHGMLGPEELEILCSKARYLAINTQTNAANQGYNTVSKYQRADFICISEKELRLDARNRRDDDIRHIIKDLADQLECAQIIITRGAMGSLSYQCDVGFIETPSFTTKVLDRVGAGDTVLSVAAPCASIGTPPEVLGLIANAVGAQAVSTIGHRSFLEHIELCRYIESLLQ